MPEDLSIISGAKREQYESLLPQIESLIDGEENLIANLANVCAALKQQFNWLWIGFYIAAEGKNELVLGPFQGPVACTRIRIGKGVCGSAVAQRKTLVVPDVNQFPGHIVCSSSSKSEIVVPIFVGERVVGVLDVDSDELDCFDDTDRVYLEKLVKMIKF